MINAVRHWSTLALNTMREDFSNSAGPELTGPGRTSRAFAMIHAALHDAYVSGCGSGKPYRLNCPPKMQPSAILGQLSGARAAYKVLRYFYQRQQTTLDAQYAAFLELMKTQPQSPKPDEVQEGERIGDKVSADLIAARLPDTEGTPPPFTPLLPPRVYGAHDADPVTVNKNLYGEYWGLTAPFLATRGDFLNLRAEPPPRLDSADYRHNLLEVKEKGHVSRRDFSIPETVIGYFWAYDGTFRMGTPPRLFNTFVHRIAEADGLSEPQWSELLCRCNLAMADAAITAWDTKFTYYLWRPVIGIRLDLAAPDPAWLPIGAPTNKANRDPVPSPRPNFTPPFPAYTSGHATFGAACFETVKLFRRRELGKAMDAADRIDLELISDELDGMAFDTDATSPRPRITKRYTSIDRMIMDNLESRVWLGVHWRFDGVRGEGAGRELARRIYANMMANSALV